MFLTSPRNSVAAQVNLFDRLKCKVLLSPNPRPPSVTVIIAAHEIRLVEVPSVNELLEKIHPYFPYDNNYHEALNQPLFAV